MGVKKVVIFGATGNTGLAILRRSIEEKLEVTVYVRTPSKVPEELRKDIKIIEGDVLNKEDVENAIKGQDAVLSALGTGMNFGPTTVISDGCKNILSAMKKYLVKKISFVSVAFLFPGTELGSQNFLRPVIEDHGRQLDAIKAESECIDWVA